MRLNKILLIGLLASGCTDETPLPEIFLEEIVDITAVSAGARSTAQSTIPISARGVCWSEQSSPTLNHSKSSDGTGAGEFSSVLSNLEPNTKYFVRAYATDENGTAYSAEQSFTTPFTMVDAISITRTDSCYFLEMSFDGNSSVRIILPGDLTGSFTPLPIDLNKMMSAVDKHFFLGQVVTSGGNFYFQSGLVRIDQVGSVFEGEVEGVARTFGGMSKTINLKFATSTVTDFTSSDCLVRSLGGYQLAGGLRLEKFDYFFLSDFSTPLLLRHDIDVRRDFYLYEGSRFIRISEADHSKLTFYSWAETDYVPIAESKCYSGGIGESSCYGYTYDGADLIRETFNSSFEHSTCTLTYDQNTSYLTLLERAVRYKRSDYVVHHNLTGVSCPDLDPSRSSETYSYQFSAAGYPISIEALGKLGYPWTTFEFTTHVEYSGCE